MRTVALYEMLFGILTLVAGIYGFTTASGLITIAVGVVAGLILVIAALAMQKGSRGGLLTCLLVTLGLLGNFGYAFFLNHDPFFPSGIVAILSIISLLLLLLMLVQPAERKRIF